MTSLLLIATLYLPVYSPKSDSQLHVAAMDTNTMAVSQSWTFPASYTGHRSVCYLPGATSDMSFAAWTGGDNYDPHTDPFGVSTGYVYPTVELTRLSPITPRFDVWKAGTMRVAATNILEGGGSLGSVPTRVRVVRWKLDDTPIYDMAVEPRVIFDKVMDPRAATTLTEADFLDADTHDLDWDNFYREVAQSLGVRGGNYRVVKADYLVIVGDGDVTSWLSSYDTNKVAVASKQVITRRFGENRVTPKPVSPGSVSPTSSGMGIVSTASPTFAWTIDSPDSEAYTAFRIVVTNEDTQAFYDTGIKRMPPRDMSGVYSWVVPADTNLWQASSAFAGRTNSWIVQAYNSKFRTDATNAVRTLFYIPATSTTP